MAATTFKEALRLHRAGRLPEAERLYAEILRASPAHFEALFYAAIAAYQQARPADALARADAALALNPGNGDLHGLRGAVLITTARPAEALASLDRAIAINPDIPELHSNRGLALHGLGREKEAIVSLDRSIALDSNNPDAYTARGTVYASLKQYDAALGDLDRAIALAPGHADAFNSRGGVRHAMKRYPAALADFDRAIALQPAYVAAHSNRANVLKDLGLSAQALIAADLAIGLDANSAQAHSARGIVLLTLNRHGEAVASCDRALALNPDSAEVHQCRGAALEAAERYDEAAASYQKALDLNPALKFLPGLVVYAHMHGCHWANFAASVTELLRRVTMGEAVSGPYPLLAMPSSAAEQKAAAITFSRERLPRIAPDALPRRTRAARKIRIGYFSADFRNHATAYLIAGLMEAHDRSQFEVFGFSFIKAPADPMRRRLENALDRLIDVDDRSDRDVAVLSRELEVDIAVDLMGHNGKNRMAIFAHRAAPIQVTYLGYPGTTGADCMDYLVADPVVLPLRNRTHFTEKIAYLPHSYQINDSKRVISDRVFARTELGLPEDGFVFCCFNNNYKITPDVFDIWMRLLSRVDGSVLWLLQGNGAAVTNLRAEAQRRGIAADRLVFAKRMSLPDHLARHRAADLLLDTFYYGAHTTASDALWVGVPVVTKAGDAFASRVGASLLTTIGLPDLITDSADAYESLAFALATQPAKLADIKQRLAVNRMTCPLFDTARFAKNIEASYLKMWKRYEAGLEPDHVEVGEGP